MQVTPLSDVSPRSRHVALGEFDGVHLGHREVIRGADTVLTFEPHPRTVISPAAAPALLTPLDVKADLIAATGVRELVVVPFDRDFARRTAQSFIDDVLVGMLGAERVSVGRNFRFGYRAQGDTDVLLAQDAFRTQVVDLVEIDGVPVSSSLIRGLVAEGDVARAQRLLGGPFELRGTVTHGDARGRRLGYPTANLVPAAGVACPAHGVYATVVGIQQADGTWSEWVAATSIGVRPTFETALGTLVEAHLLDFDQDIYGRRLRVRFLERLRGEERFQSVDELVSQMDADIEHTRRIGGQAVQIV